MFSFSRFPAHGPEIIGEYQGVFESCRALLGSLLLSLRGQKLMATKPPEFWVHILRILRMKFTDHGGQVLEEFYYKELRKKKVELL